MQYFAFYCIYRVESIKKWPNKPLLFNIFSNFVISKLDTNKNKNA